MLYDTNVVTKVEIIFSKSNIVIIKISLNKSYFTNLSFSNKMVD